MFEDFNSIEDAQIRARVVYPDITFPVAMGCVWMANNFIIVVRGKYRLFTDL